MRRLFFAFLILALLGLVGIPTAQAKGLAVQSPPWCARADSLRQIELTLGDHEVLIESQNLQEDMNPPIWVLPNGNGSAFASALVAHEHFEHVSMGRDSFGSDIWIRTYQDGTQGSGSGAMAQVTQNFTVNDQDAEIVLEYEVNLIDDPGGPYESDGVPPQFLVYYNYGSPDEDVVIDWNLRADGVPTIVSLGLEDAGEYTIIVIAQSELYGAATTTAEVNLRVECPEQQPHATASCQIARLTKVTDKGFVSDATGGAVIAGSIKHSKSAEFTATLRRRNHRGIVDYDYAAELSVRANGREETFFELENLPHDGDLTWNYRDSRFSYFIEVPGVPEPFECDSIGRGSLDDGSLDIVHPVYFLSDRSADYLTFLPSAVKNSKYQDSKVPWINVRFPDEHQRHALGKTIHFSMNVQHPELVEVSFRPHIHYLPGRQLLFDTYEVEPATTSGSTNFKFEIPEAQTLLNHLKDTGQWNEQWDDDAFELGYITIRYLGEEEVTLQRFRFSD